MMYETLKPHRDNIADEGKAQAAVSLRLQPHRIAIPVLASANRTALLAGLLGKGSNGLRHVTLTHALRRDEAYTVNFSLDNLLTGTLSPETLPALPEITDIARIAVPGFAPTSSATPLLHGETATLHAPGFDPLAALVANSSSLHTGLVGRTEPGPVLPYNEPLFLDPGAAIAALAECCKDVDLLLGLSPFHLNAEVLRALVDAQEKLRVSLFSTSDPSRSEEPVRAALARLDRWLRIGRGMQVSASLRFVGKIDPALVRIASSLLFGDFAAANSITNAAPDLSECVLAGDPLPKLVPDARTAQAITRIGLRRPRSVTGADALVIGTGTAGDAVAIAADALRQHMYVIGATGTGKTTQLRALILQDIAAGRGVFVIDPHGDLHADLCRELPDAARDRLVIADAGDFANPFSINILEVSGPHAAIQRNFVVSQLIELFKSVYGHNPEAFGPMFESYFRAALMLLMDAGGPQATLKDMDRIFGDASFRSELLDRCSDETVVSFWRNIALRARGDADLDNIAPYIVAKLVRLSGNPLIRPIVCTPKSTLDIPAALASGKVVLVNLAKGLIGAPDAAMLGGIITIRLFAAAMARAAQPAAERPLVRVYLDEFQTHAGAVLGEMMAEARKFGLSLVLANQSIAQIDGRGPDIAHAILANSGNLLSFRLGPMDAKIIADWLGPEVSSRDLLDLANHSCIVRQLQQGRPLAPALVSTRPDTACKP